MRCCLLLVLSLGCNTGTDEATDQPAPLADPGLPGVHSVGTFATTLPGVLGDDTPLQVWYPTAESTGVKHRYDHFFDGIALDHPAPDCETTHPVIVFSHGNSGVRWQSYPIVERMVSHGYIVVAPDHVGNSLGSPSQPFVDVLFRRPLDVAWSFDQAVSMPDLNGCIDPDAGYAAMGHSFGGYTTLVVAGAEIVRADVQALCDDGASGACDALAKWDEDHEPTARMRMADDRVWAAVALSPWDAGVLASGVDAIQVPTLIVTGSRDETTPLMPMVQSMYDGLSVEPRALATFPEGGHFSFIYGCGFVGDGDGCGEDWVPLEDVRDATVGVALPWLGLASGDDRNGQYLPSEHPDMQWTSTGL
ncbi:MAG: putative dienelactone hydrolase [Kiritimatiellia bacterium]|jgi:predicted dienelactone hydrolase